MTEPIPDALTALPGPRVHDPGETATIDLRFSEAQWTYRQLQARVSHAHDLLVKAEAEAEARATTAPEALVEPGSPDPLVDAQEVIAREWADTAAASASRLEAADFEVRRILETARAEARALEEEAAFLRAEPVARVQSVGSRPTTTRAHGNLDRPEGSVAR